MREIGWTLGRIFGLVMGVVCALGIPVAAHAQSLTDNPFVEFSPDGKAFTTNAGDQNCEWYEYGTEVNTGVLSTLRPLTAGEHYYESYREGLIPIGKWEVSYRFGSCCHQCSVAENESYHDLTFARTHCLETYYSGWFGFCADCGEQATAFNMYMSEEAAVSLGEINTELDYYYLCPFCTNLEQGVEIDGHICKFISWNRYRIIYDYNTSEPVTGYMENSIHMYDNHETYEGRAVAASDRLRKNTFTRVGYEFTGWNTKPDGSGTGYSDQEEILNLTDENYDGSDGGTVILYAQWKKSESVLRIDPAGGAYCGSAEITEIVGQYGTVYEPDPTNVSPPEGYAVSFDTQGGEAIAPMCNEMVFTDWVLVLPINGRYEDGKYYFTGGEGTVDLLQASYAHRAIILPQPVKSEFSFGGWYYDEACTRWAGKAGDGFIPSEDITLYAKWVSLLLTAEDNYVANSGKGAVDLAWEQNDDNNKSYIVYQSSDGNEWKLLTSTEDVTSQRTVNRLFSYSGEERVYTVPYTGIYQLELKGAQGQNYEFYTGGYGGMVMGRVWLEEGEKLTYSVGGQDGYGGGGAGDPYGNGGGCTSVSSDQKGLLLVAGGGGGAADAGNGGAGGGEAGLTEEGTGESGAVGGGGGFQGGSAGEVIVHTHTADCSHTHTGNADSGGGCYVEKQTYETRTCNPRVGGLANKASWPCACGGTVTQWHYGSISQCGGAASGHIDHGMWQYNICDTCGAENEYQTIDEDPHQYRVLITTWELGCGLDEEYACGVADGEIIGSQPAFGGSNYVNIAEIPYYSSEAGIREGDGTFEIHSVKIGYRKEQSMTGVTATDLASPNEIAEETFQKTALDDQSLMVTWKEPADNGTTYFHRVESYLPGEETVLSHSNITENTLRSGIKGYYYLLDMFEETLLTHENGQWLSSPKVTVPLFDSARYLHIAAVDAAGNIGPAIHLQLKKADAEITWPIQTEALSVYSADGAVYPAAQEDTYYVRCDGNASFVLCSGGTLLGQASAEYQINHLQYRVMTDGRADVTIDIEFPKTETITATAQFIPASDMVRTVSGETVLKDDLYSTARRSGYVRKINMEDRFVMDTSANGKTIKIIPAAIIDYQGQQICSDPMLDQENGLWLVGDNEPPAITGTEALENFKEQGSAEGGLTLVFEAIDAGSGLKEFYLVITNTDNGSRRKFNADGGYLQVTVREGDALFAGEFIAEFHAVDQVGNENIAVLSGENYAVTAYAERVLAPHRPVFRCGESGILHITAYGYVDKIEIIFPEELSVRAPDLNRFFEYNGSGYIEGEHYLFMVPLGTPLGQYSITVNAWKAGKLKSTTAMMWTLDPDESVLHDVRTRLR